MAPVTMVVPVLNEINTVDSLLTAIKLQSSKPGEILFVDAGSTDGTQYAICNWWEQYGWEGTRLEVLCKPKALPGAGRNHGVDAAKFDWIVFLDAGITPEPDWLEQLLEHLKKHPSIPAVFGLCVFDPDTPMSKAICAVSFGVGQSHVALPSSIVRRGVFNEIGYFREDLRAAEDQEWVSRFEERYGSRQVCRKALVHYQEVPSSLIATFHKWRRSARHAFCAGVHRKQITLFLIMPPIVLICASLWPTLGMIIFLSYLIVRGVIDPIRRSNSIWWNKTFYAIPLAILAAMVIDIAKWLGFMNGLIYYRNN